MNPNSPRPGHLFFTPRTPWGTRAGQQTFRQHQRASEDVPKQPSMWQKTKNAMRNAQPFFGADLEKNPDEKASFGFGAGLHFGGGEPSTGEDEKQDRDQFTSAQHGQFVDRSLQDREAGGVDAPSQRTTDQELRKAQQAWADKNPQKINEMSEASIRRFRAAQQAKAARAGTQ